MKRKVIDGYIKKFNLLIQCCVYVNEIFDADIKPRNTDDPLACMFWREGAMNGILVYFLRTLEGEEHKISDMVFKRVSEGKDGDGASVGVSEYIEAAVIVLRGLGVHIPVPPMDE